MPITTDNPPFQHGGLSDFQASIGDYSLPVFRHTTFRKCPLYPFSGVAIHLEFFQGCETYHFPRQTLYSFAPCRTARRTILKYQHRWLILVYQSINVTKRTANLALICGPETPVNKVRVSLKNGESNSTKVRINCQDAML